LLGSKILQTLSAKLPTADDLTKVQQLAAQIPWFHHVILMEKVKDLRARLWYAQQTITHGWSRSILALQIKSAAHTRAGKPVHNFHATLPPPQSDLAEQVLKDPYIFDFLTLAEPFRERELELALLAQVQRFLIELGQGFAFVGRQYHLEVGTDDFYLDLLFYHLRLRCFVVVDLKRGPFKAEYAGKMNFYCNVDYRREGENVWSRFTGGKQGTLWYYRALVNAFSGKRIQPLVQELNRILTEVESLANKGVSAKKPPSRRSLGSGR
jgi:predicted nuclease of restriction endonuclease-like (RecB) superfamily